ncbi:MAG: hypothetical protein JNL28_16640 [Planctomycetes bacterium]|nr:hypothetical protein [Planctomycetota bacterium]
MKLTHCLLLFALASPPAVAQSVEHAYVFDSGFVPAPSAGATITIGFVVDVPGATSLRLRFSDVELAGGAQLRIVSLADGAKQTHTQFTARQWNNTSAYFNGDAVWVEVLAQPSTDPSRVRLESVSAGVAVPPSPSQCGTSDDRALSSDPRVGRLQPSICTAFLVEHCSHPLMTAGHCVGGFNIVEFNVPISSSGGNLIHPPPSDQYAIDPLSLRSSATAIGSDWAIFGCFANPDTGKTPYEAQLVAFTRQAPPAFDPSLTMRVTGYGYDLSPPERNFSQQTHAGPYFSLSGNVVRYQADTMGGNSGSPVILESTGAVIAIHTNGGCDALLTGSNAGTSLSSGSVLGALSTPQGVLSCTGTWSTYCTAQVNSQGCTPAISALGTPKASLGAGSFTIRATNVLNQQNGILFYGINGENISFQGGTLCVRSPLTRTGITNSGGSTGGTDCSGVISYDMGARIASGVDPRLHAGATLFAQFWQRDGFAAPFTTNLTDAIRFTIGN